MHLKNTFYTLLIFFIYNVANAQSTNDSLQNATYDSLRNWYQNYRFSDFEKAKKVTNAYYQKAILEKNEFEITTGAFLNAIIYDALSQQDSAHHYIDIYISRSKAASNMESYASGIYKKGVIYYHSRNFHEATQYYTKAYELSKHTTKKHKLVIIKNSIGLLKNQFGQHKQALSYFKENSSFFEKNIEEKKTHKSNYLNTLNNISNTYTNLSEEYPDLKKIYLDSATIYNEIGLKKSMEENDLEINTSFLTVKGIIFQKLGKLQEAFQYFFAAEKQTERLSFNGKLRLVSSLQLYIGKNYFLNKEYTKAIAYLRKVDMLAEKENITSPFFQETYILLAQCYEKKNNQELAIKYYKRFKEKDAENDQTSKDISESLYKQYDIPSLKNKINQLQKLSSKQKKLSNVLLFVSLGLLMIIFVSVSLYRNRIRKQKKRFDAILEKLKNTENTTTKEQHVKANTLKDENIVKILQGLAKFEEKKLFLQKNCSINFVAKKIHTNKTYLSKTLQSHKQKKFVNYITDLRIDYALSQLKNDATFRKYDIKSIASELGFNTAESFSKAFKKRTGIYPSFYIKNLDKLT